MTTLRTLRNLTRASFPGASWAPWWAFLAAVLGERATGADAALVRRCTGRTTLPTDAAREASAIVGRRGGKSRVAALVAILLACLRDYRGVLAPGETGVVMVIAADRKQARVVFGYVRALLASVPTLAALVAAETKDSITLTTGIVIEIHTASFRAVRGYTVVGAVLDEIAFWPTDDSADPDTEILNALRPAMATVPGALLLAISSPYARRGELWRAFDKHHGRDDDPVLVWQADTATMNPSMAGSAVIAAAYEADPAAASAEYGAEFRRDVEAFVAAEALAAVTVAGRYELPPQVAA